MAVAQVGFLPSFACVSVLPHGISKIDEPRITKLDILMFHDESWKSTDFGVKRSKVKVTSHKNIADVGLCTFVNAGFFWLSVITFSFRLIYPAFFRGFTPK